jgi:hypothetical protein
VSVAYEQSQRRWVVGGKSPHRFTTLCGVNPAGMAVMESPIFFKVSIFTPVCFIFESWSGPLNPCQ